MALLHSTLHHITLPRLYFTLLDSTLLYHNSTSHYLSLITLPWIYFIPLDSTLLYSVSTSLYSTLHYSTIATSLYLTLRYTTPALINSLNMILPCLFFTLPYSTFFYNGSTSLYTSFYMTLPCIYFTLHFFTMAPFHSSLLNSTSLYITPWSTSLNLTLHYSTMVQLHPIIDSTSHYHGST